MVELVDTTDLKSVAHVGVRVRFPLVVLNHKNNRRWEMELLIGVSVLCLAVWTYLLYQHELRHQETERQLQQLQEKHTNTKQ